MSSDVLHLFCCHKENFICRNRQREWKTFAQSDGQFDIFTRGREPRSAAESTSDFVVVGGGGGVCVVVESLPKMARCSRVMACICSLFYYCSIISCHLSRKFSVKMTRHGIALFDFWPFDKIFVISTCIFWPLFPLVMHFGNGLVHLPKSIRELYFYPRAVFGMLFLFFL